MELRQLELFVAVCEDLHFGHAAVKMHLSQPALSHQIARLEDGLGVQLFDRSHRRAALTPAGRALLSDAPGLLREAQTVTKHIRDVAAGRVGRLRLGFVGTTMLRLVPQVVQRMRVHAPDVFVSVVERSTAELVGRLQDTTLDAAFIYHLDSAYPNVQVHPLGTESVGIALPRGHALSQRKAVRLAELADDDFIVFPRDLGPDNYDRLMDRCADEGFTPRVRQEAESIPTILGMVAAGLGVGFASETVMQTLRRDGVVFVKLRPAPRVGVGLAHHSSAADPVVDTLRRIVAEITGVPA